MTGESALTFTFTISVKPHPLSRARLASGRARAALRRLLDRLSAAEPVAPETDPPDARRSDDGSEVAEAARPHRDVTALVHAPAAPPRPLVPSSIPEAST